MRYIGFHNMGLRDFVHQQISVLGEFMIFVGQTFRSFFGLWTRRDHFFHQCEFIGVSSMGIITLAALFFGAVMGYQFYVAFHWFGMEQMLGGSVGVSLFRDLAPVMSAIMVTGRAGAAIAAELASMRISEQIDALEVMGVDPLEYLVAPRVAAGISMMPILSVYFAVIASASAALISCGVMDLSFATYWHEYARFTDRIDLIHCLTKSLCFGLVLVSVGCFYGFYAQGGARAVGWATRTTVVMSCVGILLSDYIVTSLLPFGFSNLVME